MKNIRFMQKLISFFSYILALFCLLSFLSCAEINRNSESDNINGLLTFAVLNVGQGLSQAVVSNEKAIICDMGDVDEFTMWQDGYTKLGSPFIEAIVISHGDMDHKGGLKLLPSDTKFSGLVVTSPYEDTASLRAFATNWSSSIRYKIVKQGDTLGLINGFYIKCIWPPKSPETDQWVEDNFNKNRFSLCFKIEYDNTSFLITGDIDTIAQDKLVERYQFDLNSDIVVVPHHGSRGSLHSLFYGYVNPDIAIISCGINNIYGHPSDDVIKLLAFQMVVTIYDTRYDNHVVGRSNGEYWVW